jgi:hypothetical protein
MTAYSGLWIDFATATSTDPEMGYPKRGYAMLGYCGAVGTGITPGHDDRPSGIQPVLIHVWTVTLEGPASLSEPLARSSVDELTNALGSFLADVQVALSEACRARLILRAAE